MFKNLLEIYVLWDLNDLNFLSLSMSLISKICINIIPA
jgi:hypothetical protein